jgi:hypothetical protein
MTEAFIRNLKLLNAKERDHLMRFAYLGEGAPYESASTFLSREADDRLRVHAVEMGLAPSARCVFAGMDYHLDWLFVALWMARHSPAWTPLEGGEPPFEPMAVHEAVADTKALYTDFRPVSGSQEDVDLLVVYDDDDKLAVLCIEAKGSASFDKVQLARKLIRLDRILVDAGMTSDERSMEFRLVLAAPKRPSFDSCLDFARSLPVAKAGGDKFDAMRAALATHRSGIGVGLHYLCIGGFPIGAHAVERERGVSGDPAFTHWTLRKRA